MRGLFCCMNSKMVSFDKSFVVSILELKLIELHFGFDLFLHSANIFVILSIVKFKFLQNL